MADEKLAAQLTKLKATMTKWTEILSNYKQWAMADGIIDATEQAQIDRIQNDINAIKARIALIEKKKGINQEPAEEKGFFDTIVDGAKEIAGKVVDTVKEVVEDVVDYFDGEEESKPTETPVAVPPTETTAPPTPTPVSTSSISGSVGKGGKNDAADVRVVQTLLNNHGNRLTVDGDCGAKSIAAIEKFQKEVVGLSKPDGRIDPGGRTWTALSAGSSQPQNEQPNNEDNQGQEEVAEEDTTSHPGPIVQPNSSLTGQVGQGKANAPGDVAAIQILLNKFGNSFSVDGVFTAELAAAIEKFQKDEVGLSRPDGVVDPGGKTWRTLNGQKPGAPPPGPMNKPNWISIAEGEIGQKEKAGAQHNPRIIEYHATTGGFKDDETAWCSSFVNWVMKKAGQGGTNSAGAVSWARWGKKVEQPAYGAIAVIDWDGPGPGWKGHVGFVVGKQGSSVLLLGGNQSNSVNVATFGTSKIIAYVYPSNFEIPANFFSFGEAEGDFGGDTDMSNTR